MVPKQFHSPLQNIIIYHPVISPAVLLQIKAIATLEATHVWCHRCYWSMLIITAEKLCVYLAEINNTGQVRNGLFLNSSKLLLPTTTFHLWYFTLPSRKELIFYKFNSVLHRGGKELVVGVFKQVL